MAKGITIAQETGLGGVFSYTPSIPEFLERF